MEVTLHSLHSNCKNLQKITVVNVSSTKYNYLKTWRLAKIVVTL